MEARRGRTRRAFTAEFKGQVVELCRTSGKSVGQVCRDLELTETAVRRWLAQAEIESGQREGLRTDERAELAQGLRERIDKTAAKLKDVPEAELDELIDEAVDHVRHHRS